jgi:hypothetical protein
MNLNIYGLIGISSLIIWAMKNGKSIRRHWRITWSKGKGIDP